MEITAYVSGIGAIVVFGIAALLGVLHMRDASIWTTWAGCLLTLTGGFCWLQDREWKRDTEKTDSVRISVAIENAMVTEAKKTQTLVWFGYGKDGTPTIISPVSDMLYLRLTNGIGAAPIMIDYFSIEARSAGGKWKPASQININEGRLFWASDQGLKSATEVTLDKPQLTDAVIDKNIGSGETIKGWAVLERPIITMQNGALTFLP